MPDDDKRDEVECEGPLDTEIPQECGLSAEFMGHPQGPHNHDDFFYACGNHVAEWVRAAGKPCVIYGSWCGGPKVS